MSVSTRLLAASAASALAVGLAAAVPASAAPSTTGHAQRLIVKATPQQVAEMSQIAAAQKIAVAQKNDSHGCSGSEVSDNSYVHVCYVRDGDVIWVHDDEANGYTAVGQIYYYDSAGFNGPGYYYGYCFDRYSSSGPWDHCGFGEADENRTIQYRGYDTKGNTTAHFTRWQSESSS